MIRGKSEGVGQILGCNTGSSVVTKHCACELETLTCIREKFTRPERSGADQQCNSCVGKMGSQLHPDCSHFKSSCLMVLTCTIGQHGMYRETRPVEGRVTIHNDASNAEQPRFVSSSLTCRLCCPAALRWQRQRAGNADAQGRGRAQHGCQPAEVSAAQPGPRPVRARPQSRPRQSEVS